MNDFIKFSKDEADNNFRGEFTMQTNPPQPRVQYIPTVNSVPITPEKPSPIAVPPPPKIKKKPKQKYQSLMNKSELMEEGDKYGLGLTDDMTKKTMLTKINEAKNNDNIAHPDSSVTSEDRDNNL